MATSPELRAHQDWIGLAQPVGLVVAPTALLQAGVVLPERLSDQQEAWRRAVSFDEDTGHAHLSSVKDLLQFLEWPENYLVHKTEESWGPLEAAVPEYQDTLRPSFAVLDPDNTAQHIMLIKEVTDGADLDASGRDEGNGRWHASHQARLERLLKATNIPIGLLFNKLCVRLVYAPQGESSGYLTFPFKALCDSANKPMLGALLMLLRGDRLFSLGTEQRLPSLLKESRKYQNTVTEKLADQVLAALNELLAGLQVADKNSDGVLLRDVIKEQPQLIYEGLVSVMMRLVFLLYSEERGVLPQDPYYLGNYSILRLFERLRDDDALHSDTMEQRYGAWAQLMTLFRMVFEGIAYEAGGKTVHVPPRQGDLFNPDRFGFLEGRPLRVNHSKGAKEQLPLVPDGTVLKVLRNLLILDGERLSYRALDVEQIGSVYEALMGFELSRAKGPSLALKPDHVVVDLKELLGTSAAAREKFLNEQAGVKVTGEAQKALKTASTLEELAALLDRRKSHLTPDLIPVGGLFFQVTNERRRSGSHYTPRSLTEPIVDTTLKPVLDSLGPNPTPAQILELKVCDPAMGSGAFLVAACRWLADRLLGAWQQHNAMPRIPPDEDPVLHARRIVALNCLYGVDKNPFAVNLAKLSLWLATLAKDHPFTFLDHALKHGDSLVGLDLDQISSLSWEASSTKAKQVPLAGKTARDAVKEAEARRAELRALGDSDDTEKSKYLNHEAQEAAEEARCIGDHIVAAFFGAENAKGRAKKLEELAALLNQSKKLPRPELHGQTPFHWQLEFPEVFDRGNGGFDGFVGNPPFAGKNSLTEGADVLYSTWLIQLFEGHGNANLAAYFLRRCAALSAKDGVIGLVVPDNLGAGDTRAVGLGYVQKKGGKIFNVRRRQLWEGTADVAFAVVSIAFGRPTQFAVPMLDGRSVVSISSEFSTRPERSEPECLLSRRGLAFQGTIPGGHLVLSMPERDAVVLADAVTAPRLRRYVSGKELAVLGAKSPDRFVIDLPFQTEEEARARYSTLMNYAAARLEASGDGTAKSAMAAKRRANWWRFTSPATNLYSALGRLTRCMVTIYTAKHRYFVFMDTDFVFDQTLVVIALAAYADFAIAQSRLHEAWMKVRSTPFGSSVTSGPVPRYSISDGFETFPFPPASALDPSSPLESLGAKLYDARAAFMVEQNHGLTVTYNKLKDPQCMDGDVVKLRAMHEDMDRAVLHAYGWDDIQVPPFATPTTDAGRKALEAFEDEVIDRLFALNAERAAEEKRAAGAAPKPAKAAGKKKASPKSAKEPELDLK